MADNEKLKRIKENKEKSRQAADQEIREELGAISKWSMVANQKDDDIVEFEEQESLQFVGKNLENGKFSGENLQGANFSVANLTNVDFSGANLQGVDFSGANLTGANLSGADLTGAILSGAVLASANFNKAKLLGVKLVDVDIENAILSDIEIDEITLEGLQELVEYIAKYYPHKLLLRNLNLRLLNLASIDLSRLDLRGVDFSGVDFTGVSIVGLDLSECKITPEQIAQALGRVPTAEELAKILAPKPKKKQSIKGVDFTDLFLGDARDYGVWDFSKDKGISIEDLMKIGKKVFGGGKKPEIKDEKALKEAKSEKDVEAKNHNEELRKVIEERKQKELESRKALKENAEKNSESRKEINIPIKDAGRGR